MTELKKHYQMNRDQKAIVQLLATRKFKGATTTEMQEVGFNGYRGRISELRHDFDPPVNIVCKYEGTNEDGRKMHRYYLEQYRPMITPDKPDETFVPDAPNEPVAKPVVKEPVERPKPKPKQEAMPLTEKIGPNPKSDYDRKVEAYQLAEKNYTWTRSKENKQKLDQATADLEEAIRIERAKEQRATL